MKPVILFDIDGTAMPIGLSLGTPSERLKAVIGTLQPRYHISTATGRSLYFAKHIIEFLGLTDPCIIAAGTEIYDPVKKEIIWREAIPVHTYDHIVEALKNNKNRAKSGDKPELGITGATITQLLTDDVAVLYVNEVDPLEATELVNVLQHPDLHIINMHAFADDTKRDIHIHSVKASKEHAVNALLDILHVAKKDSTVIGDGLNDLHLFVAGGTKVAMGNAVAELKAAADIVIGSIDDDGMAAYLESLV